MTFDLPAAPSRSFGEARPAGSLMNKLMDHKIAIVVNPNAGSGRALQSLSEIERMLRDRGIEYRAFPNDWPEAFDGFTAVWIVGGDGTINYFINHYPEIQLPLVLFKGGSGNDFHSLLYGNKTVKEIIEIALTTKPIRTDAGRCNERLFVNGLGIGFDGSVAKALVGKNKRPGQVSFLTVILQKIFFYRGRNYSIVSDELKMEKKLLMINVMNGRSSGGGFFVSPLAELADGKFDVNIVVELHTLKRMRFLPVIEKGKHVDLPFIKYFHTSKISIRSDQPMDMHLDGEYLSQTTAEIEMLPGKFLFYAP